MKSDCEEAKRRLLEVRRGCAARRHLRAAPVTGSRVCVCVCVGVCVCVCVCV